MSRGPAALRIFAVGPSWVQLDWASLAPGRHRFEAGPSSCEVHSQGGPGTVTLDGLDAGATVPLVVDGRPAATVTTLVPPSGPVLCRIATLNDLHLGEDAFGFLPRCRSGQDASRAHPVICLEAALAEISAWAPDLLVIKGDLADSNHPGEYELLAEALDGFTAPLLLIPGNHDGGNHRHADALRCLADLGLVLVDDVGHVDLPGLRVVGANSVWPGHDRGKLTPRLPQLTAALAGAGGPAFLAIHHQVMRGPVPHYLPPGLLGREARRVLDAVATANPDTVVASGHSHRHRAQRAGPLLLAEVGSPKDYPGSWAAYEVYATGIVQTARRIADPAAIRWTQSTYRTVGTMWGRWSPGRLGDRSYVHLWSNGTRL